MLRPYKARHACALDVLFAWVVVGSCTIEYDAIPLRYESVEFGPRDWMMQFHVVQTILHRPVISQYTWRGEQINCIIILANFAICGRQTFRSDYVKDDVGRVCSMNEKKCKQN